MSTADAPTETLLELLGRLDQVRRPEALKSWLFRVAARKAARLRRQAKDHPPLTEAPWAEATDTPGLRRMLEAERAQRVRQAVCSLPPGMRAAMVLTVVEDFTVQQAARICEVPVGTIKSRLFHGRQLLRNWLVDYGPKGDAT